MAAILEYTFKSEKDTTVKMILKNFFDISTGLMRELASNGKIFLNSKPCKVVDKVKTNDTVTVDVTEKVLSTENIEPFFTELKIIYEDDFILVVDKDGNTESHPCLSNRRTTLGNAVMGYWVGQGELHKYHIVNRLDKGTSGVSVVAKNRFSHGVLSKQLQNGDFKKKYIAAIHGRITPSSGEIECPISRTDGSIIKRETSKDGKYAKTVYKTLSFNEKYSLVEVSPQTGRTHQIRVHFSSKNHPLVGDWLYGTGDMEKEIILRPALHLNYVSFLHPKTKQRLEFIADVPKDINQIVNK